MSGVRAVAPAKVNWTLEVLRARPDGYHELRSVVQTLDLHDVVTVAPARAITIAVRGPEAGALADAPAESNLAYRAAAALARRAGGAVGARMTLEKRIPVAAGLGGGSSDAAAVLRALNRLWGLGLPREALAEVAAEVGSDPPSFCYGGTTLVSGRGERVEPLPDAATPPLLLATPPPADRGEKTARMFAALRPAMFTAGDATDGVREAIVAGRAVVDAALCNVFERVVPELQPATARAMAALAAQGYTAHLCGAGPSFFVLLPDVAGRGLAARVRELGFEPRRVRATGRRSALWMRRA